MRRDDKNNDEEDLKILTKTLQRKTIADDVARFLTAGGAITPVDHTANHGFNQPTKRTRRQQVEYSKRHNQVKRSRD